MGNWKYSNNKNIKIVRFYSDTCKLCEVLDIGKFVAKGDGNAIMDILNQIDDVTNSNATFILTEKGNALLDKLKNDKE